MPDLDEQVDGQQPDPAEGIALLHSLLDGKTAGQNTEEVRWKTFKLYVKEVNDDGTFEGYASVWGVIDSDEEVVDRGSCLRSLKNNPNFVLLWQHKIDHPIGFAVTAAEDEYGLKLKGELMLDCEIGRYAYAFLKKAQKLNGRAGLSIGFRVLKDKWIEDEKSKKSLRHFVEIQLLETSVVTFAANANAFVTSVKSKFLEGIDNMDEKELEQAGDATKATEGVDETKMMTAGDSTSTPSGATTDFDAMLAEKQRQRELRKNRSDIEDALYDTLSAIHGSSMDDDGKKSAIGDCYMKHAKAMTDYHIKSYFGDQKAAFDAVVIRKGAADPETLLKANPKVSSAAKAILTHALDLHASAIDLHGKAMKLVKDAFDSDSGSTEGLGTEMGAMGAAPKTEEKSDPKQETTVAQEVDKKAPVDSEQQSESGDSGIHSLMTDLRESAKSRLESIKNNG